MTEKPKSPSRAAGYADTVRALVARDGLTCFLCGHKHATSHTLQADARNPDKPFGLDNLIVTCKPCAKRRNGKKLGAYWRERLLATAAEAAHIEAMARNKDVLSALSGTVVFVPDAAPGTGDEPDPWANIVPTFFVDTRMLVEDYDEIGTKPKNPKHGDVFQEANYHSGEIEEFVFYGEKNKWIELPRAQERGLFPADWPPANVKIWRG
jgi:hypothetical protein